MFMGGLEKLHIINLDLAGAPLLALVCPAKELLPLDHGVKGPPLLIRVTILEGKIVQVVIILALLNPPEVTNTILVHPRLILIALTRVPAVVSGLGAYSRDTPRLTSASILLMVPTNGSQDKSRNFS